MTLKCYPLDIYPLTIICDRYDGTYSGAKYLAFNLHHDCIPYGVNGDDIECFDFWREKHNFPIGKGNTLTEAAVDLWKQMKEGK